MCSLDIEAGHAPLMLATTLPDFVLALGRHRQMAGIAHELLDQAIPSSNQARGQTKIKCVAAWLMASVSPILATTLILPS